MADRPSNLSMQVTTLLMRPRMKVPHVDDLGAVLPKPPHAIELSSTVW